MKKHSYQKNPRIYLDYASITPLDPRVLKSMLPYLKDNFHNASSLYQEGLITRDAVNEARKKVAYYFQSKPNEVIFTSGGTEANNLALQGVYSVLDHKIKIHMITSRVEHSSVLEVFKYFETKDVDVTYLDVDTEGKISTDSLIQSIRKETRLISLMYGNNEIGTINDIARLSKEIKKHTEKKKYKKIIFHTDASQGACYLNIRADYLGVDLITIDGSKLYGPRGSGALFIKNGTALQPVIFGGGHERGIRSGTENTSAIVGLARALEICQEDRVVETKRLEKMRDEVIEKLISNIDGLTINGSLKNRLPNNINFCIKDMDSEFMVIKLDQQGIACSSVTTCKNLMDDSSSYVIENLNPNCSRSSLRLSIGRHTDNEELDRAVKIIIKNIKR